MKKMLVRILCYLSIGLLVCFAHAKTVVLTDDLGRAVRVESTGQRWISLAPHLTESFLAAGLANRLIAVDQYSPNTDVLAGVRRLPGLIPNQPTLFRLSPTVIWVWYTSPASRLLALERQGVPVFYSCPLNLDSIPRLLEKLKPFTDHPVQIDKVKADWENHLKELRERYKTAKIIRVFHPFSWRPLMSFNHTHWLSQALKVCGAESVTDSLPLSVSLVKPDYVKEQHTDVVLLADKLPLPKLKILWDEAEPGLSDLVLITVNPDDWHRPSPNFLKGLDEVCTKIDRFRRAS